jgi:hypothetical protein
MRSEIITAKQTRVIIAMTSSFVFISALMALAVLMECQDGLKCTVHALIVSVSCMAYIGTLYVESFLMARNERILV